jgi:hypothetical protein
MINIESPAHAEPDVQRSQVRSGKGVGLAADWVSRKQGGEGT